MKPTNLSQLKELLGKWRSTGNKLAGADYEGPHCEGMRLLECANELEPLLAALLAEREALTRILRAVEKLERMGDLLPAHENELLKIRHALAEVPGE